MAGSWLPGTAPKGKAQDESPVRDATTAEGGSARRIVVEPDERTSLLPQETPTNRSGYLSPDDPAVSPYNLWSVRFMRYFTIAFLVSVLADSWFNLAKMLRLSPSSGGFCFSSRCSSVRLSCTLAAPASSTSHIPHSRQ